MNLASVSQLPHKAKKGGYAVKLKCSWISHILECTQKAGRCYAYVNYLCVTPEEEVWHLVCTSRWEFRCNLPPALLAEWPGSFTCHCGNAGVEWTPKSEWADCATVGAKCGNLSGKELTRNLWWNIQPQSSQLAEPLWTDPGIKSGISVHELISTSKAKQKKRRWEVNGWTFPHIILARRKPPL